MRDELLRHVFGPTSYASGWLWLGVVLILLVFGWYIAVFVATLPSARLRGRSVVGTLHAELLRRRYAHRIAGIAADHEAARIPAAEACAAISRTVRSFLHQATGVRAQYMQIAAIADSSVGPAAPLLAELGEARFNEDAHGDVSGLATRAQELVRTWT